MSRRKGQVTLAQTQRRWPFAVVVPREVLITSIQLERAYPTMATRTSHLYFHGREFVVVYFSDGTEAERFRCRARGWNLQRDTTGSCGPTVWPPRDPRASACEAG